MRFRPYFARRYWVLWLGAILAGLALFCSLTPTLWILEGRPSESYPEYAAILYGYPLAVLVLLVGLYFSRRDRADPPSQLDE